MDQKSLWDKTNVPEDADEFGNWVGRRDSFDPKWKFFAPKPQHCGLWKSSPNKERHASFGDDGTTASTNCYGDLIQMSQFLGAGRSGVFTIDQTSTSEPCYVVDRAQDLNSLSTDRGAKISLGLLVPDELFPRQEKPPEVKWVHWRWPRYEYDTMVPGVRACFQYMVHEGVVLQQFTVEKTGDALDPEGNLEFLAQLKIRDLDFLDGDYPFNYYREWPHNSCSGPAGYGLVHVRNLENTSNDQGATSTLQSNQAPGNVTAGSSSTNQVQSQADDAPVAQDTSVASPPPGTSKPVMTSKPISDHQVSAGPPHSVAAVITIFRDGVAIKTGVQVDGVVDLGPCKVQGKPCNSGTGSSETGSSETGSSETGSSETGSSETGSSETGSSETGSSETGSSETGSNTLQIVVAYKLLLLPDSEINWRNFVISAEAANINHWLREEEERSWGDHDSTKLCDARLSMINLQETHAEGGRQDAANPDNGGSSLEPTVAASPDFNPTSHGQPDTTTIKPETLDRKERLEYFAWRHLEHILSVCAIPLSKPRVMGIGENNDVISVALTCSDMSGYSGPPDDVSLVALTCGDMSGHRVNTPASFFAFKFLVDIARRLKRLDPWTPYIKSLEKRIEATCRGHIRWLQLLLEENQPKENRDRLPRNNNKVGNLHFLQARCFAANYWVTGKIMSEDSYRWQPPNAMTDTALQVLKLAELSKLFPLEDVEVAKKGDAKKGDAKKGDDKKGDDKKGDDEKKAVRHLLDDIYIPFLVELDRLDMRGAFAWPHAQVEGINTFRLDDHFWIWKALKFLDSVATKVPDQSRRRKHNDTGEMSQLRSKHPWLRLLYEKETGDAEDKEEFEAAKKFTAIAKRLSPNSVQRGILQRFTTENDVTGTRMLAVSRSARATRFILHARDTALFYGQDCDFFTTESSFDELWKSTIDTQRYHEENKEAVWGNALRYALGIVMGTRGYSLNKIGAIGLVEDCVKILIGSSGHDAFFPGELDESGREPAIFDDERHRDFFYHAGFEINCVLLSNGRKIDELSREADRSQLSSLQQPSSIQSSDLKEEFRRLRLSIENFLELRKMDTPRLSNNPQQLNMKKFLPFTNAFHPSNINSFEEEWLYNYPDFLWGNKVDDKDVESLLHSEAFNGMSTKGTISKEIKNLKQSEEPRNYFPDQKDLSAYVADIEKQKCLGKRHDKTWPWSGRSHATKMDSNRELFDHLRASRTAAKAKKRFIWLDQPGHRTAFACWAASPERERHAISLFFDRHARCDKHVWDDTNMVLNQWQTELHLSYFVLVDEKASRESRETGFPDVDDIKLIWPKRNAMHLCRASVSFRIDGDFFDRYWTCHLTEHDPGTGPRKGWNFPSESKTEEGTASLAEMRKAWWQRRVLELLLVNRTLDMVAKAAYSIRNQVNDALPRPQNSLSPFILDGKTDPVYTKYGLQFEQVLQRVEDDLISTLATVQKWSSREKNRGDKNPRWTRNDEKKYRTAINRARGKMERTIEILEHRRDNIRRLKEDLAEMRTKAQKKVEFHHNQNIRYFTYATVIFLPLGFAASLFSMSGAPDHAVIVSFVKVAIAAFAVTIAILLCTRMGFEIFENFNLQVGASISNKVTHVTGEARRTMGSVALYIVLAPSRAVSVLKGEQQLSLRAVSYVVEGILFAPIFGMSWLVKLLLLNIFDLLQTWGNLIYIWQEGCAHDLLIRCRSSGIGTRLWRPRSSADYQEDLTSKENKDKDRWHVISKIPPSMRPWKGNKATMTNSGQEQVGDARASQSTSDS